MPFFKIVLAAFKNDFFIPVIVILGYVVFIVIIRGSLPTAGEIIGIFSSLYSQYGYQIIFTAAALETLIMVNFFVPGMITIALGAIFARTGQVELTLVVLFATLGAIVGYLLDFILGRFGFSKVIKNLGYGGLLEKAKNQLGKKRASALILGFAHPNVGAFISLSAGAVGLRFWHFFTIAALSALVWASIWGIAIYSIGDIILTMLYRYSFLVALAVLVGLLLTRMIGKEK